MPAIAKRPFSFVGLNGALLTKMVEADAAIARFDESMEAICEHGAAERQSVASVLNRLEASASSSIEGHDVTQEQLALASLGSKIDRSAAPVVHNVAALGCVTSNVDGHLSNEALLEQHAALVGDTGQQTAGRFREHQAWVGLGSAPLERAEFVPPHSELVAESMQDLLVFMRRKDLPVVAQAAISHAHFMTIHPFAEPVGRIGRTWTQSLLISRGASGHTVPFSRALYVERNEYRRALREYREGRPAPVVDLFCRAFVNACGRGQALIRNLLLDHRQRAVRIRARSDSAAFTIHRHLMGQPIIDLGFTRELGLHQPAAHRAIARLVEAGILRESTDRRRYRSWCDDSTLVMLNGFER